MNPLALGTYPQIGDNIRREFVQFESEITLASGTSEYKFFNVAITDKFLHNKQFPLAGDEAFEMTGISLEISSPLLHSDLDNADQILLGSFLEIKRGDTDNIQLPLSEVLSAWVPEYIGTDAAGGYFNYRKIDNSYEFLNRLLFNSQQRAIFRLYLSADAATELTTLTIRCKISGFHYEKFIPFDLRPTPGEFEFIDYVMYHVFPLATANANEFNLFTDKTLAQNLLSKGLPLSPDERIDVHAIKVFMVNSATDVSPFAFYNNRRTNYLKVKIGDTEILQHSIADFLSFTQSLATTVNDNAGSPVATNLKVNHYHKAKALVLKVPLILPPQKEVKITLTQPGSSDGETTDLAMVALHGEYGRRVAQ